jgi:hypothetical protein
VIGHNLTRQHTCSFAPMARGMTARRTTRLCPLGIDDMDRQNYITGIADFARWVRLIHGSVEHCRVFARRARMTRRRAASEVTEASDDSTVARNQTDEEEYDRDNEEQVHERAHRVGPDNSKQPRDQQDDR